MASLPLAPHGSPLRFEDHKHRPIVVEVLRDPEDPELPYLLENDTPADVNMFVTFTRACGCSDIVRDVHVLVVADPGTPWGTVYPLMFAMEFCHPRTRYHPAFATTGIRETNPPGRTP